MSEHLTEIQASVERFHRENKRMTATDKYARLVNALKALSSEEQEAMIYGMDHPEEFGADRVCIGGFYQHREDGTTGYCPETLMMLKMGTATMDPMFFSQTFEKGDSRIYDNLWRAIDNYLPPGAEEEEEELRQKETIHTVRRILEGLA